MCSPSKEKTPVVEPSSDASPQSDLTMRALNLRIRQQEILAELGVLALKGTPFDALLNQTARLTAEGLEADFCKVMEYLPTYNKFLVRAGVGWDPAIIGSAKVGADLASPAGFALRTGKPVISNHLENEQRFRTPELLLQYGVRRAMNVILQGDGSPFGVLEVDARSEGDFSEKDIAFLQGAANVLGMAIERERRERRLAAALERQQILIKEIHHRVKNSLQLVSSMLHLQASSGAPELQQQLQEAASRVLAIARAHESIYNNGEVGVLDLGKYLREVCHSLNLSSYACALEITAAEGIQLATDRAIPLVLIATELMINAAKYAFPDPAKGKIRIVLTKQDDNHLLLTVADNGVGLPPDFSIEKAKGLGMRMIRAFAEQLGARLDLRLARPGAELAVVVPHT
jgi:two-component sensor histidine kinase